MYIKIFICASFICFTTAQNNLGYISEFLELIDDDFKGLFPNDVKFFLYDKESRNRPIRITTVDTTLNNVNFSRPFKFIIHGYTDSANKSWVLDMKDQYLKKADFNVIAVDWSKPANEFYPTSAHLTKPVGSFVSNLIIHLHRIFGVPYTNFHLIGHSLGAHVSGFAGTVVFQKEKKKLGRITGMDPAGPFFFDKSPYDRLTRTDAQFVDVIHTDGKIAGYFDPLGHADFYPNGGVAIQPGCLKSLSFVKFVSCSHSRSYIYFTESINSKKFIGTQCSNFDDYEKGLCNTNPTAIMGANIDKKARGIFFLTTNEAAPFPRDGQI